MSRRSTKQRKAALRRQKETVKGWVYIDGVAYRADRVFVPDKGEIVVRAPFDFLDPFGTNV